ncbi:XdhC family protein [Tumebacillus sp. ITR2]|uniref:XdhC family protein n=1 Tax=Tumebacillus amylolyticus TaxID=2801339 RepID=A0ABS1JAX2_9BACL|nr:XdhC family protein [Tumebacillus amylolyticus]MBL0387423.1 XdhC family protein [Tumebacillus amylolyticus]
MTDVPRLLQVVAECETPGLLATIVHVEGSAYRKAGAVMVFFADGTTCGVLSAGCLEQDVAERVASVWSRGVAQTVVFDLRAEDDLSWGQGPGCNGQVTVLLEPLDGRLRAELEFVREKLERGEEVEVCKRYDGGEFVQRYEPRPRLVLLGAGPDARPVATMATQAGFSVTVADWREGFCKKEWFPKAESLVVDRAELLLSRVELTARDYVVLMTHHYQHDRLLLRGLLAHDLRYLGVLGPRRRTARLLGGQEVEVPEIVHSPVGLAIGAEGPEEIAVSIVAELVQARRCRGARS